MDDFTLTFLGSDSGFGKQNNSAYFEEKDSLFIIDCGCTVFEQIKGKFDLNRYNSIYVIITHLHNDHAGSLSQLILYSWFMHHKKIVVISACTNIKEYLDITGTPSESYEIRKSLENLEFIKTEHTDFLDTYGFKLNINNKKIVYTSDTKTIKPFEPYLTDIDELYIDVSRYGGAHIKIEDVINQLSELKNKGINIGLMHLDDRKYISEISKNQFIILK